MPPSTSAVAATVLSLLTTLVLVLWHFALVLAPAAWAVAREFLPLVWHAVEQVAHAITTSRR